MGKWEARVGEMVNTVEKRLSAVAPNQNSKCESKLNTNTSYSLIFSAVYIRKNT